MSAEKKIEAVENQEINEIVNDIGKLQAELQKTAEPVAQRPNLTVVPDLPAEPPVEGHEFQGGGSGEASLEDTLGSMKEEEPASGKSILDVAPAEPTPAPVVAAEAEPAAAVETVAQQSLEKEVEAEVSREIEENTSAAEDGSLTLKLTGKMKLKLNYEYSGNEVSVHFDEDFLHVEMADGTEFKIPVHKKSQSSQAA